MCYLCYLSLRIFQRSTFLLVSPSFDFPPLTLSLFAPLISLLRSEEVGDPSNNDSVLFIPDSVGTVIGPPPFTVFRSLSIISIFQFLRGSSFHALFLIFPLFR